MSEITTMTVDLSNMGTLEGNLGRYDHHNRFTYRSWYCDLVTCTCDLEIRLALVRPARFFRESDVNVAQRGSAVLKTYLLTYRRITSCGILSKS